MFLTKTQIATIAGAFVGLIATHVWVLNRTESELRDEKKINYYKTLTIETLKRQLQDAVHQYMKD